MRELTVDQCEDINGGIVVALAVGLVVLGSLSAAALGAAIGYAVEESQDAKC